jgi:CelD/BcsL family acetyltransferase involved in cellulose biosynthesis
MSSKTSHSKQAAMALPTNVRTDKTATVGDLPYGGSLSLVNTLDQLYALEPGWRKLENSGKGCPSVFQSFDWIASWSKVYLSNADVFELMLVAGHQDGELVFVMPLMKKRGAAAQILTWLTDPSGQYGDVLLAPDHSATVWMDAALSLLRKLKNVDLIRLRHVREDAVIHTYAQTKLKCARLFEQAPYLNLTAFASEQDYDARYNSQQRKRRKKIRKSLEEIGAVEFKSLPAGSLADQAMAEAISEKNKWLKERGRRNVILKCSAHMEFLKTLARTSKGAVETVVTELTAGGKAISWEIGFRFRNKHFAYITSHRTDLTDLSPGRLHMDLSQRKALNEGLSTFDLMVPNDQHKESWSSKMVATRDYYVPLTARGAVFGWLYLEQVRPLARNVYYKLPSSLLVWIQKIIQR